MRCAFALTLLALCSGCRGPKWDTPEDAYASFAQALERGETKVAYEALSEDTRKAIETRSKEISSASGGAVKDEPALLAFATGHRPQPLTQVKVARREEASAVVSATSGGETAEVRMVKEGERWKVDLSDSFKK
ncbi:MAG: DUF4878 domain-containing protein [Myxococcales bacterium]|nr:DUF4878 domain-containing protein [Myxococcales bacterium]